MEQKSFIKFVIQDNGKTQGEVSKSLGRIEQSLFKSVNSDRVQVRDFIKILNSLDHDLVVVYKGENYTIT